MVTFMTSTNTRQDYSPQKSFRDVTSTARLFHFKLPVYVTDNVWKDCIDIQNYRDKQIDDLAVLHRLRHVLFMAASTLHGRTEIREHKLRVYRIPNTEPGQQRRPEAVDLNLSIHKDEDENSIVTIKFPDE